MRSIPLFISLVALVGCVDDPDGSPAVTDASTAGQLDAGDDADQGAGGGVDAGAGGAGGMDAGADGGGGSMDAGAGGEGGGGDLDAGAGGGGGADRSVDPPDFAVCNEAGVCWDHCDEAGVCYDAAIADAAAVPLDEGAPDPERGFDWLMLFDDGTPDDGVGVTGADFCGVSSDCGFPVAATYFQGGGTLCDAPGQGCAADRTDPTAILDDGAQCEAASEPSDYVSLGTDGSIFVQFSENLAGCEVTVVEHVGRVNEAWVAFVCDSDDLAFARCVNQDEPVYEAAAGGPASFHVPEE